MFQESETLEEIFQGLSGNNNQKENPEKLKFKEFIRKYSSLTGITLYILESKNIEDDVKKHFKQINNLIEYYNNSIEKIKKDKSITTDIIKELEFYGNMIKKIYINYVNSLLILTSLTKDEQNGILKLDINKDIFLEKSKKLSLNNPLVEVLKMNNLISTQEKKYEETKDPKFADEIEKNRDKLKNLDKKYKESYMKKILTYFDNMEKRPRYKGIEVFSKEKESYITETLSSLLNNSLSNSIESVDKNLSIYSELIDKKQTKENAQKLKDLQPVTGFSAPQLGV